MHIATMKVGHNSLEGDEGMQSHNILIVSASIGSGHTQAAQAVQNELLHRFPQANITVVDFFADSRWLGLIKKTYLLMLHVLPDAYDFLYHQSQKSNPGSNVKNLTARVMKKRMLNLVEQYCPDMLVFTHPFPCCAAAYLRRTGRLNVPLYAIITDFAAHQSWVHDEVASYFVANTEVVAALRRMGVDRQIFNTGIPISADFTQLPPNRRCLAEPVVLIMGGGLGLGGVEESVAALAALRLPLRLVVVTGKNRSLQKRLALLKKLSPHPVELIGYTDRVHELMAKASLLITKPGALTCSEAMALELPLLLFAPLPGQEEENAAYLTRQGAALKITTSAELAKMVSQLLADTAQMATLRSNARNTARPYAASEIAEILKGHISDILPFTGKAG